MGNISIGGRLSLLQRVASLDLRYGPYSSIADAYENMGPSGDEVITAGLPFGVIEDDGSVSVYIWTKGEDATQDDCKKLDKDHIVLFNGFIDISVSIKQQSYGNIATKDNIVFLSDRKQFAYRDGLNFYINWQNRYIWSNNNYIPYDDIIYIDIANNRSYYFDGTTLVGLGSDTVIKSINDKAPDSNGNINISKEDFELGNVDNTSDEDKVVKGANEDGDGNNIATTYETKADATIKQTALQEAIANLTGLDSTNFGGFSIQSTEADAISNIATLYTADGYTDELLWYMAGTSLSSVKAYRYNGSGTPTAISSDTYNCVDFSGLIADVSTLSQNLAALGPKVDDLINDTSYELRTSLTLSFNHSALAYNSSSLNLEVGKTYKFVLQTSSFNSGAIAFYLRKVAADNTPNIKITNDATGIQVALGPSLLSREFLFTPTTAEYQFIAAWHNDNVRLTQDIEVEVYDIVKGFNVKGRIEDLEDRTEALEDIVVIGEESLSFTGVPQQQKVITNGNWVDSVQGYYSRMIQTQEGSYRIVASNSKPAFVAVFSTRPDQTAGTAANPDEAYTINAGGSETIQCTKGQWMLLRDDSANNTYLLPSVYFDAGTRIDELGRRIEEIYLVSKVLEASYISGGGVIADKANQKFGQVLSTTSAYSYTDYIDISGAVKLDVTTVFCGKTYAGKSIVGAVLYDANKNPITGHGYFVADAVGDGGIKFSIIPPSNAKFVRNTFWTGGLAGVVAYYPQGVQTQSEVPAIIARNQREIEAIYAAKKMSHSTFGYNLPNHVLNFCVAHITDIHCDTLRYKNFREFIDNVGGINAAVMTGDIVIDPTSTQFASITGVSGEKEVLMCVGNHDKGAASSGTVPTNESIYTLMGMNTNTGKLYYYKDYTATEPVKNGVVYKIRMIFLNQYDIDGVTGSLINNYTTYSQEQIDWLISTLQDAKTNGYAVMVCLHTQDRNMGCTVNTKKFYDRVYDTSGKAGAGPDPIIEDIVNAFKTGGTLTKDYTWGNISRTVSVNASFSGAGTFIAYLSGHLHRDCIAYSANYPDQLYLGGNCGCCYARGYVNRPYGTEMSALPRVEGEKSEDCFNVYGINMEAHLICVVRVGATINDRMENIDYDVYEF